MPWLQLFYQRMNRFEVGAPAVVNFFISLAVEGIELFRAHLEFLHVFAEMMHVIAHRGPEALAWICDFLEAVLQAAKQRLEGVQLYPVQQFFLAGHIVIDSGKTEPGLGGDLSHGRAVVALPREYARRCAQETLPFAVK